MVQSSAGRVSHRHPIDETKETKRTPKFKKGGNDFYRIMEKEKLKTNPIHKQPLRPKLGA